jgi:DNA-binding CsgD family transcriptional regulator
MDAQLVEPAMKTPIDFDVIDFDALQAYLSLYVQNLHSLSNVSQTRFGALCNCDADFHIEVRIGAGVVSFVELDRPDQRITGLIDIASARRDAQTVSPNSLSLVFFRVESTDATGARLALISLGLHASGAVHSYQLFEVTSQADFAEILETPSLSAMHQVSHYLLRRHFVLRSSQTPQPVTKRLTERQLQIVRLVAGGLSDKQIARQLGLSQHTVRNMVRRLLAKYALRKRIQLCGLAADTGIADTLS